MPKRGSGAYFTRLHLEHCQEEGLPHLRYGKPAEFVIDPKRREVAAAWILEVLKPVVDSLPTDRRTVLGQDFGRDGDLSVIWVLQEETRFRWRTAFVLELRRIPFDVQQQILFWVIDNLPLFHHGKFDARGNGQSHAEAALQRYGAGKIECVMLSRSWYAEWYPRYHRAYEDRSILVPKSEDIIADHRQVVLDKGTPVMADTRVKGTDGEFRHGDSAVSGVLAWAASREEGGEPFKVTAVVPLRTDAMFRGYRLR